MLVTIWIFLNVIEVMNICDRKPHSNPRLIYHFYPGARTMNIAHYCSLTMSVTCPIIIKTTILPHPLSLADGAVHIHCLSREGCNSTNKKCQINSSDLGSD